MREREEEEGVALHLRVLVNSLASLPPTQHAANPGVNIVGTVYNPLCTALLARTRVLQVGSRHVYPRPHVVPPLC